MDITTLFDEAHLTRLRNRAMYLGFGAGFAVGLLITAIHFAISGCKILPFHLVWNLIWAPMIGLLVGYRRSIVSREGVLPQFTLRISMGTLMVVIAYIGLLFGLGQSTSRVGNFARGYYQKASSSRQQSEFFEKVWKQLKETAKEKEENARYLRSGKIPATLPPEQKKWLASLDEKKDLARRKDGFELIAGFEAEFGLMQEKNAVTYRSLTDYHKLLAEKYEKAEMRPWEPVEPDPPLP